MICHFVKNDYLCIPIPYMTYDIYSIYASVQFQASLETFFIHSLDSNVILYFSYLNLTFKSNQGIFYSKRHFERSSLLFKTSMFSLIFWLSIPSFLNVFFQTFVSSFIISVLYYLIISSIILSFIVIGFSLTYFTALLARFLFCKVVFFSFFVSIYENSSSIWIGNTEWILKCFQARTIMKLKHTVIVHNSDQ